MPTTLTPAQRQLLKAKAHRLHAVVMVGDKGLTPAVIDAIDAGLKSHELIKIRVASEDRDQRGQWLEEICASLDAIAVQQIGRILVIYRENPEPPPAPPPRRAKVMRKSRRT
jgi:putative YhbY family RNA-binding protein